MFSVVFRRALCANCNGQKFPRSVRPCRVWLNCSRSIQANAVFLWQIFSSSALHSHWPKRWERTQSRPPRASMRGQADSEVERGAGRPRGTRSQTSAKKPVTATYQLRLLQLFWGRAQPPPRHTSPFLAPADCSPSHGLLLQRAASHRRRNCSSCYSGSRTPRRRGARRPRGNR